MPFYTLFGGCFTAQNCYTLCICVISNENSIENFDQIFHSLLYAIHSNIICVEYLEIIMQTACILYNEEGFRETHFVYCVKFGF